MQIDLILLPGSELPGEWSYGETHTLAFTGELAAARLEQILQRTQAEWLLFWDGALGEPPVELLTNWMRDSIDVVHGGLRMGLAGQPAALDRVITDWSWLDPPLNTRSTSWRVSLRCALIRTQALRTIGGLDPAFETLEGAGMELGFRLMRRGAMVWFDPQLVRKSVSVSAPSAVDAFVFVRRWFKPHWARYLEARQLLGGAGPGVEWSAARSASKACDRYPGPDRNVVVRHQVLSRMHVGGAPPASVSAIIPTLGRYPYIQAALNSLSAQTLRPTEVLIVDQNPPEMRRPDVYEPYQDLNLRVIWLKDRGQSLARNAGLAEAKGDYVFLFEDDAVAEPDLIEQHFTWLQHSEAHVSTGVSIPPPPIQYELPEEFRFPRVAQTFSSGNSLLTREALRLVGGFDRNYDHGVNADMDFGTRLYLAGGLILHNPHATMIHYKAPMGGLRVYGHWWAHSNIGMLRPFPPPTQVYYMLRFLSPRQRRERLMRFLLMASLGWEKKQSHARGSKALRLAQNLVLLPLMPYRVARSFQAARKLLAAGPHIPEAHGLSEAHSLPVSGARS